VQFVLRHERTHRLRFAALDSDVGRQVRARHPELADVDSMVWVESPGESGEHVSIRSDAALETARYMGGPWRLSTIGSLIPRAIRDRLYDLIARHRHRLAPEQCYVPPPAVRARFL
jgi:predicted DCC family thiol-disulfide oxidoreductase YuxK